MKKSIHTVALFFILLVSAISTQADSLTVNDSGSTSLDADIDLVLTLKVSTITIDESADSADAAAMLKRRLESEQTLWAVVEVQTRVYRSELIKFDAPMDRRISNSINGLSLMLDQGRREAQKRFNIFEQDQFDDYFGYTDVLNLSNRIYKSHYSVNRSHEIINPKLISIPGP